MTSSRPPRIRLYTHPTPSEGAVSPLGGWTGASFPLGLEYPVYDPCVRTYLGSSGRLSSSIAWRHRVREHLAHGVSVRTEHLGCFPDAHAVYHTGSSDAQIQPHLVHPSHLPWALGIALWKVADGPVFKRVQLTFEPSTRYTLLPSFTHHRGGVKTKKCRPRSACTLP